MSTLKSLFKKQKTNIRNTVTVHRLLLSACTAISLQVSGCTSSAVTFFNARPISAPRTSESMWRKKKHTRFAQADLVNIQKINPRIIVELRYASKNNFTGKKIYQTNTCYLKKATALKLDCVQKELETQGLGLKIWDGYRPPEAQKKLWELVP
ncbi:MAG: M15 family metallopeptidase, partial [Hydrogenophaga sp.]|nr:M15 family metallopeptidase [Hydrogenophaga sp.]